MEEIENTELLGKEKLLFSFLIFLKEKGFIDDFSFEFEKEISCFLNKDVLEKHGDLVYGDLIKLFESFDNKESLACDVLNVIQGKADA